MDWSSKKLPRVAKSTLAAETQSYDNAADGTECIRTLFAELTDPKVELQKFTEYLQKYPAAVATDCRSVYEVLTKTTCAGQATSEKRLAIEVILLKEKIEQGSLAVLWCPTTHMHVDPLTKEMKQDTFREFLEKSRVCFGDWQPPSANSLR